MPRTLELDIAPGRRTPIFVRHALDSPWVESRMDVLVDAVPIVVGHFLPIACEVPPLAAQKWPIPSTKRPMVLHWVISWTLCAVHHEADILGQVWMCAQGCWGCM